MPDRTDSGQGRDALDAAMDALEKAITLGSWPAVRRAYRVMYERAYGKVPPGLWVPAFKALKEEG